MSYHIRTLRPALNEFACGRVEVLPSMTHGDGLFAVDSIRRRVLVGKYECERIIGLGCYCIDVAVDRGDSLADIVVDSTLCGNLTHFMNH